MKKISNLFEIKYLQLDVSDWYRKKPLIENLLSSVPNTRQNVQNFSTNRQSNTDGLIQPFLDILKDEFGEISKFLNNNLHLKSLWSVEYSKHDYHSVHSHGHQGYSGILYLNYIEGHPATSFIQPWSDSYSDMTIHKKTDAIEGRIIVTPSFLNHFSLPNKLDELKKIVAFDLGFAND